MSTYHIQTIGCQMNERDSETIAGLLEQMGYKKAAEQDGADVLIINTCSVRENADNRFFGLLGRLKHVKTKRPDAIIAVCGCMMQQEHIVDQIKDKHAFVDVIFGTHNIDAVPDLIEGILRERKTKRAAKDPVVQILTERDGLKEGLPAKREYSFKASVNIMYGCNNFCTYCIVPYTRGREISRDAERIIAEVRGLAEAGTKEILLLGQNVNSYNGFAGATYGDAGDEGLFEKNGEKTRIDFADLITLVDEVPGIERIRFMTSHPKDLSDKLIGRFAADGDICCGGIGGSVNSGMNGGARHLCPSIHLPIQSGSTRILERMNRHYTKEGYIGLVEKLRAARPDMVVSTDFIVGFPGETAEDFEHTMDVIERVRFDAAFTFLYSPRKGTPAAGYDDNESGEVKQERFDRMVRRLNEITLEKNRAYVGTVQDVLVEGLSRTDPSMCSGRTFGNKLVNFSTQIGERPDHRIGEAVSSPKLLAMIRRDSTHTASSLVGAIVPVRITSVKTFSFTGELLSLKNA